MKNTKKTNRIARTVTAAMAAVMMMTGAASVMASADDSSGACDNRGIMKVLNLKAPDNEPIDILKYTGKKLMEEGIDKVAAMIPGGGFFADFIKDMIGDCIDGEKSDKDKVGEALERLQQQNEEIIAKFDELKTQIEDLRTNNNRNTKWLSNIIIQEGEKVTLRDFFSTLTSEIKELNFEIRAIELSDEYTAEEKLVQLAALNDNKHLENIRLALSKIKDTMNGGCTELDVNLFELLLDSASRDKMFFREAYEAAKPSADALIKDYIIGCMLVMKCENAAANLRFDEKNTDNLRKAQYKALYETWTDSRKKISNNERYIDTVAMLAAGVNAYNDSFLGSIGKYDKVFINKGLNNNVLFFNGRCGTAFDKEFDEDIRKQNVTAEQIIEIADYVREKGKGQMTVAQFLEANNIHVNTPENAAGKRVIVVDAKKRSVDKYDRREIVSDRPGHKFENYITIHNDYIKVIDIDDPECRVQEVSVRTYENVDRNYGDNTPRALRTMKLNTFTFVTVTCDDYSYERDSEEGRAAVQKPAAESSGRFIKIDWGNIGCGYGSNPFDR